MWPHELKANSIKKGYLRGESSIEKLSCSWSPFPAPLCKPVLSNLALTTSLAETVFETFIILSRTKFLHSPIEREPD